jgi:GAF domain-containing protein
MAVPSLDGETLIGVIDLESDRTAGFSPSDLNLFATLANEAARVLPRLWQVDRLKAKARQLESLVNTGQTLVTKLERQELFDTLTREARHMLAARACALYQHEAEHGSVRLASFAGEAAWTPPDGKLPLASCLVGTAIQKRRQMSYADVSASPDYAELVDLPPDPGLKSALVSPCWPTARCSACWWYSRGRSGVSTTTRNASARRWLDSVPWLTRTRASTPGFSRARTRCGKTNA